jgi:ribose/xylose/arabinose/galactoside ABC-type transport system permease subunit
MFPVMFCCYFSNVYFVLIIYFKIVSFVVTLVTCILYRLFILKLLYCFNLQF